MEKLVIAALLVLAASGIAEAAVHHVPDGGSTVALFGGAILGLDALRRWFRT